MERIAAKEWNQLEYEFSESWAKEQDKKDPFKYYRDLFTFPTLGTGVSHTYLNGNSLGLQGKYFREYVMEELRMLEDYGVEGHWTPGNLPGSGSWKDYNKSIAESMAPLVGGKPHIEVAASDAGLTRNLHQMLFSFYGSIQRARKFNKKNALILMDPREFPSDKYAIQQIAKMFGIKVENIVYFEVDGNNHIGLQQIEDAMKKYRGKLVQVMIPGVINYYTGQYTDPKAAAAMVKKYDENTVIGADLAHTFGNRFLDLSDTHVDWAIWCLYKYINGGPGTPGGVYVDQNFLNKLGKKIDEILRLAGWFGHNEKTQFDMPDQYDPRAGAEGYAQVSNGPILSMAGTRGALEDFNQVRKKEGLKALRLKSIKLTNYLEHVINEVSQNSKGEYDLKIVTPSNPEERGAQLSVEVTGGSAKDLEKALRRLHVMIDDRKPNGLRIAPVPLYNSFEDVYKFGKALEQALAG